MPWDPVRDLLTMQERLECLFGQASGWVPPVDLCELADRYVMTIEVPGVTREDIRLDVQGDTLVLSGRRPDRGAPERYHQLERGQGGFSRSFRFAQPIHAAGITADLADGVLTVTIPKAATSIHIDVV